MIRFSSQFGSGSSARPRLMWTGTDRNIPGIVLAQKDVYNIRAGGSNVLPEDIVNNGTYYIGHVGTNIYVSTDAITWTNRNPVAFVNSGGQPVTVAALGSLLLTMGYDGSSYRLYSSSDGGVTQTYRAGGTGQRVVVAGSIGYVLASSSTTFYTSTDAVTWTSRTTVSGSWSNVLYNGTKWIMVSGTNASNYAVTYSSDGLSFTTSTSFNTALAKLNANFLGQADLRSAFSVNGKFVFPLKNGGMFASLVSSDGITWSVGSSFPAFPDNFVVNAIGAACVVNGVGYLKIVGYDVTMTATINYCERLISTVDGINWKTYPIHGSNGNTGSLAPGSVFSKIDGITVCFNEYLASPLNVIEANISNAKELYYEL